MRENISIDLFKYAFACMIPMLHIVSSNPIFLDMAQYIARLGVPFFFAASGLFLGIKLKRDPDYKWTIAKKYCKRIIGMFCIWEAIYAPFQLSKIFPVYGVPRGVAIWLHDVVMCCPSYLWYLVATVIGVLLFVVTYQKRYALPLVAMLYILGTVMNSYRPFLPECSVLGAYYQLFQTTRNGLFFGFPCIFLGSLVGDKEIQKRAMAIGLLISSLLYVVEVSLVRGVVPASTDTSMYFTIPLVIFFLLRILVAADPCARFPFIRNQAPFLRHSSTVIYVTQFGLIMAAVVLFNIVGFSSGWATWAVVILLGTLTGAMTFKRKIGKVLF